MKTITTTVLFLIAFSASFATNVLLNSDFETGNTSNWVPFGSSTIAASTVEKHGGSYSCLVDNRSFNYSGVAQSIKALVLQGVFYEFTAWVKVKEPLSILLDNVGYFRIALKIDPVSGANQYPEVGVVKVYKTGWIKIRGYYRFDLPISDYNDIIVDIQGPDSAVDFYVDDLTIETPLTYTPPSSVASDFVRASGRNIVVGAANQAIKLQGINFWAYSDDLNDNAMDVVFNSYKYDWSDYAKVAALGYNCVRLNMDFRAFEDDNNPYNYKQEGWEWLERNIIHAKNNGIYLLLDMHTPQGGYQSYGFLGDFWGNTAAAIANRDRLTALWVAIATRYKDEPAIAGFDLINEALPPTAVEYYTYIQSLINAIRVVDTHHLINIEMAFTPGGSSYNHQLLTDAQNNLMYDSHYYYRWAYASQLIPAYGGNDGGNYPDASVGFDKNDLETILLDDGLQFCIDNNVPHNAGEFGLSKYIFPIPVKGALTWMTDVYDLHNTHKVNAQQWTWHSNAWGLYTNTFGFPDQDYVVTELETFLQNNNTNMFGPLPVEYLLPLQAFVQENKILLTWSSAVEENNAYFEVERSNNGRDWQKIGDIAAKGSQSSYKVDDNNPLVGNNIYRLRQVDVDGQFEYSNTVSIKWMRKNTSINIHPNPFFDQCVITIEGEQTNHQCFIYNIRGELVKTVSRKEGNSFVITKGNLALGIYYIKVSDKHGSPIVKKIMIQ